MALELGTNCGFVITAPVGDPNPRSQDTQDGYINWEKDTSPSTAIKVIEIGFWCDNATEESNFEVGIYTHDAVNDEPDTLIGSDRTNAKGTDAGWKRVTGLNITISSNTVYWIGVQLDDTATATKLGYDSEAVEGKMAWEVGSTLPAVASPGWSVENNLYAIYAVVKKGVEEEKKGGVVASKLIGGSMIR